MPMTKTEKVKADTNSKKSVISNTDDQIVSVLDKGKTIFSGFQSQKWENVGRRYFSLCGELVFVVLFK